MGWESGIKTFRDSDGLWENYRIEDVCTPEALERNPELVNHFYNERRKQLYEAQPNAGHKGLAELENYFDVRIITQNIDDCTNVPVANMFYTCMETEESEKQ